LFIDRIRTFHAARPFRARPTVDGNLVRASSFAAARGVRRAVVCMLILAGAFQVRPAAAVAVADAGRKLKAAYLVRVAAYVDWPDAVFARADSPLVIGIAGDDALAEQAAQYMAGRLVHGHPLAVRRIGAGTPPPGLHMLFAAAGPARTRLLDAVHSQPVLTVCDGPPERHCVVGLVAEGDRLRVRIDRLEALAAQLRVSARLLALGTW
jgi:hypothetical protein